MTAYELYRQARLDEAIEAALHRVKAAPTDLDGRLLLCDLLCFDNQLERADRQLDVVVQQDAGMAAGIGLYRQLVRAELARRDVFQSGRPPELMNEITGVFELHMRAAMALREGNVHEAGDCMRQAEPLRPSLQGECDGQTFAELRDLNDLTAPFLEVLTSTGKYYWIPWERIEKLEFRPPKYLRDLIWRQTDMVIREGPEALVYVPVLYPETHRSTDPELRLGRRTDWVETPGGPTTGLGQRTLLVGDVDQAILSIGRISFSPGGGATPSAE
jgi:type VI secretion system protein ImpE